MNGFNVKRVEYLNKVEYRLFSSPIIKGHNIDSHNSKYIEVNGLQVNSDTGEIRTEKSINHSNYVSKNRTINKIYEYAFSNSWDYFLTFTFAPDKVNRYDYDECYKKISKFMQNFKNRKCSSLKYLLIPEMHKDGAFHFHGLLSDIPDSFFVDSGLKSNGYTIYNFNDYKLGFSTATKVSDTKRVSTYITKYITKELNINTKGKHRYLVSTNISKPNVTEEFYTTDEFNKLKMNLLTECVYFKELKSDNSDRICTYVHINK